jgi:transposase-like protein
MIQLEDALDAITKESAWKWIHQRYLPQGVTCPSCGSAISTEKALAAWWKQERTYCKACDSSFRAKSVTPLAGTEWEADEYVKLIILVGTGRRVSDIARILGKSHGAVKAMIDRIEIGSLLAA